MHLTCITVSACIVSSLGVSQYPARAECGPANEPLCQEDRALAGKRRIDPLPLRFSQTQLQQQLDVQLLNDNPAAVSGLPAAQSAEVEEEPAVLAAPAAPAEQQIAAAADAADGMLETTAPAEVPVTPPAAGAVPQPAQLLVTGVDRPWHARGTGRPTKRYNMTVDIGLLEAAEKQWQTQQAAAAAAEAARLRALAEAEAAAKAKAAAEAEATARAEAEAIAKAQAEAEAAARAEAEAAAAELAAAEAALAAAEAEAAAIAAAEEEAARAAAQAAAEAEAKAAAEVKEQMAADASAAAEEAAALTAIEAARAQAEAAAAVLAAQKTPASFKTAKAVATPKSSGSLRAGWSPIEGVPEMHTRPCTTRRSAAAAAATPGQSLTFTPLEGVPETARGFRRQTTASKGSKKAIAAKAAFTPVEGVPEKDLSFQRTPFDRQLRQAQLAADLQAGAAAGNSAGTLCSDSMAGPTPTRPAAAGSASVLGQANSDTGGLTESDMAAALQHVDSLVAGITSASPNTPLNSKLPVHLLSAGRSKAAATTAAESVEAPAPAADAEPTPPLAAPASVVRIETDQPGRMDVAIQYSALRTRHAAAQQRADATGPAAGGVSARVAPATRASGAAGAASRTEAAAGALQDADAAGADAAGADAMWDDDGDDYAGAGGDYDDVQDDVNAAAQEQHDGTEAAIAGRQARINAMHDATPPPECAEAVQQVRSAAAAAAGASPIPRLTPESPRVQRRAPSNADATAAAAAATAEPDSGEDAVAAGAEAGRGRAQKRSYRSIATPREGRVAKARKSLAGDGLAVASDGRRVSTRQRQKPMEFWRNEHKEYVRDHKSLPTVKRYVAVTPDPVWPAPSTQEERKVKKQKQQEKEQEAAAAEAAAVAAAAGSSSAGGVVRRGRGRPHKKSSSKTKH